MKPGSFKFLKTFSLALLYSVHVFCFETVLAAPVENGDFSFSAERTTQPARHSEAPLISDYRMILKHGEAPQAVKIAWLCALLFTAFAGIFSIAQIDSSLLLKSAFWRIDVVPGTLKRHKFLRIFLI